MEIVIKPGKSMLQIQEDFSKIFPFLKIEFFESPHGPKEISPRSKLISSEKRLKEGLKGINAKSLFLFGDTTVKELEARFKTDFGLYVQVFRKSGNLWIETSLTDNWTLDRQNQEAFDLGSGKYRFEIPESGYDPDVDS
jgi:hypothetical protein